MSSDSRPGTSLPDAGGPVGESEPVVMTVTEERLHVRKQLVESGGAVRLRKIVHEEIVAVDEPLITEVAEVEQSAIDRLFDTALEDAAFMIPLAKASSERHRELRMPVAIFAGAKDLVIDVDAHSTRLHRDVSHRQLTVVPGTGHMVHYAVPQDIVAAIDEQSPDPHVAAKTVLAPVAAETLDGLSPRPAALERAA